jgi:hypothetical protein
VIEGVRVRPFYEKARKAGFLRIGPTCSDCKERNSVTTRQSLACGYEPRVEDAQAWHPRYFVKQGITLETCPGYTASLPEVAEVLDAYPHWEAGTLDDLLDGRRAPGALLRALVMMKAGANDFNEAKRQEQLD